METLIIDRGRWLTGNARRILGTSALLISKPGLMCCLGFYAGACGVTTKRMDHVPDISDLKSNGVELGCSTDWLFKTADKADYRKAAGSTVQGLLVDTNDSDKLHQSRREARIKKLFKKYGGIDVTFVGKYADATRKARKAVSA